MPLATFSATHLALALTCTYWILLPLFMTLLSFCSYMSLCSTVAVLVLLIPFSLFLYVRGATRILHLSIRRQRQMGIGDSPGSGRRARRPSPRARDTLSPGG